MMIILRLLFCFFFVLCLGEVEVPNNNKNQKLFIDIINHNKRNKTDITTVGIVTIEANEGGGFQLLLDPAILQQSERLTSVVTDRKADRQDPSDLKLATLCLSKRGTLNLLA